MNELKQLIHEYFDKQRLMQLVSISVAGPWACSVWQVIDDDFNIYFFSSESRRHSKEIAIDDRVAGVLALPQTPEDNPRGIQFEGVAQKLVDVGEVGKVRKLYQGSIFDSKSIDDFMSHPERPHVFYKIKPSKIVLFDTVNFPDEPLQEMIVNI